MAGFGPLLLLGGVGIATLLAARSGTAEPSASKRPKLPGEKDMPLSLKEMVARAMRALTVNEYGQIVGPVTKEAIQQATSAAGQVAAAGFPKAAEDLRRWAKLAAESLPKTSSDKTIPKPPAIDPRLWEKVQRAIDLERDPKKLAKLLDALRKEPRSAERDMAITILKTLIAQILAAEGTGKTIDKIDKVEKKPTTPSKPKPTPKPKPPKKPPEPIPEKKPPEPKPEPKPKSKEQILAERVALHLQKVEAPYGENVKAAKGKEDKALVKSFQTSAGIVADGLAGPGTLLAIAKLGVSDLPYVLYWPKAATRERVYTYRREIQELSDIAYAHGDEVRGSEYGRSAAKERGQAGIVGPLAV